MYEQLLEYEKAHEKVEASAADPTLVLDKLTVARSLAFDNYDIPGMLPMPTSGGSSLRMSIYDDYDVTTQFDQGVTLLESLISDSKKSHEILKIREGASPEAIQSAWEELASKARIEN